MNEGKAAFLSLGTFANLLKKAQWEYRLGTLEASVLSFEQSRHSTSCRSIRDDTAYPLVW